MPIEGDNLEERVEVAGEVEQWNPAGREPAERVENEEPRGGTTPPDAPQQASEEMELERASSACRHAGGVKFAERAILAKPRTAGNEESSATLAVKFPPGCHTAVSKAAAAAVLAGAAEVKDGSTPSWCSDEDYASQMLFDVASSGSA